MFLDGLLFKGCLLRALGRVCFEKILRTDGEFTRHIPKAMKAGRLANAATVV